MEELELMLFVKTTKALLPSHGSRRTPLVTIKTIGAEVSKENVALKVEREGEIVDPKCKLLVGADGAHSWTRRYFKLGRPKEMMTDSKQM